MFLVVQLCIHKGRLGNLEEVLKWKNHGDWLTSIYQVLPILSHIFLGGKLPKLPSGPHLAPKPHDTNGLPFWVPYPQCVAKSSPNHIEVHYILTFWMDKNQ